jgi:hypothetical protein
MHVGTEMFKHHLLMGIFPLPPPSPTATITHIKMISSFTKGYLGYFDPWVVPHSEDVDSYGASMPLTLLDISYQVMYSTSTGYDLDSPQDVESNQYPCHSWALTLPLDSNDFLSI